MSRLRAMPTPALVIPDDQTWTIRADDPAARGLAAVDSPGAAELVLMPAEVPPVLMEPLSRLLLQVPEGAVFERGEPAALEAAPGRSVLGGVVESPKPGAADEDGDDHGDDHGGGGDMMAIVGEPSADGLVMESMSVRYGPLGTSLPGGLLLTATLDGDVVAEADIAALLEVPTRADGTPAAPDRLTPLAWSAAIAAAEDAAAPRSLPVGPLEIERAVSHLAWLRAFGRILDWPPLIGACTDALRPLAPTAGQAPDPEDALRLLAQAAREAAKVDRLLRGSRTLRRRIAGLGVVSEQVASERDLAGPNARASGLAVDARDRDPRYAELGFEPAVRREGDALARALVRSAEVAGAIALAAATLQRPEVDAEARPQAVTAESARGPITATRSAGGWRYEAPGSAAAREVAAEVMTGEEWGSALLVAASFDLSPWIVGR